MTEPVKALRWAAALSIVAGIVHGMLTDAHFAEWWAYGVFFMLAAMAQGLYGFAILASEVLNGAPISARWSLRARRTWYALGIGGNGLLILLYVASRTTGVLSEREAWDPLGVFTKLVELALVVSLVFLLWRAA